MSVSDPRKNHVLPESFLWSRRQHESGESRWFIVYRSRYSEISASCETEWNDERVETVVSVLRQRGEDADQRAYTRILSMYPAQGSA